MQHNNLLRTNLSKTK